MSATNSTFSMEAYKTNVLIWGMLMTSSMKAAIHLGPNFNWKSEICKNTSRILRVCSTSLKRLLREHSEEILNVKCLEYSSLSWARSVLANEKSIRREKAKVRDNADSVLYVG